MVGGREGKSTWDLFYDGKLPSITIFEMINVLTELYNIIVHHNRIWDFLTSEVPSSPRFQIDFFFFSAGYLVSLVVKKICLSFALIYLTAK